MPPLDEEEIDRRLWDGEWEREGDAITRELRFDDFLAAVAFVNRVAEAAQDADHHPDILVYGYNKVRLTLSTHSEGGVTERDFELASEIDRLA